MSAYRSSAYERCGNGRCKDCLRVVDDVNPRSGRVFVRCAPCRGKSVVKEMARRAALKASRKCVCGRSLDRAGSVCRLCLVKSNARHRRQHAARKCYRCGKPSARFWGCLACRRKKLDYMARYLLGRRARAGVGVAAVPVSGVPQSVAGAV